MFSKILSASMSVGLESCLKDIKGASVVLHNQKPYLDKIFYLSPEHGDVKQLYINHPIISTALNGKDVLVRPLSLPLTKEKDIEASLIFQTEPLLPYPIDEALITHQILSKSEENSELTVLATRKEILASHLEPWRSLEIEPEIVSCIPSALCEFGATYLSQYQSFLFLHLGSRELTGVWVKEGKLMASFALMEGFLPILEAKQKEKLLVLPHSEKQWQELEQQNTGLADAFKRFQKEVTKMVYALSKECRGEPLEGIAIAGTPAEWIGFSPTLVSHLSLPLLLPESFRVFATNDLLSFAVPIGLAIAGLPSSAPAIDFRQQEYRFPYPWQRLRKPLFSYFGCILLLCGAFYFFSSQYLHYQEDQLRQTYFDLLAEMHKSPTQFEVAYLSKNPQAKEQKAESMLPIEQITQEGLMDRLAFLQKELQATPDSFPLFANIPRVSDIMSWLNQYSLTAVPDEEQFSLPSIQIENFNYIMLKRPQHGKKQEKYQVKIELEFSSSTPKWARQFHDALIAPNDWVDPKGEVKWSANRGKYKTSFFLKDKTAYPSS